MDPFKKSVLDGGKYSEYRKVGLDFTAVISYKNSLVVNGKPVTVSLALGEGVACNTIFSWPFLKKIKPSIITNNNNLVNGLLGYHFSWILWFHKEPRKHPKNQREYW